MRRTIITGAVLGFTLGIVGQAASADAPVNRLANAGFEEDITGDGPPFVGSWESFSLDGDQFTGGDIAFSSEALPRTGDRSLELAITIPNSFAGAFQDVDNLIPGEEWTFWGWHTSLAEPGGIEIRIEWRDSVNDTEISRTPNLTPIVTDRWELFRVDATVPAGADLARIVYAIQSFGAEPDQSVFVDDVSFTDAYNGPCNAADIAEPFGQLGTLDICGFIRAFLGQEPAGDLAAPFGVFDLADVNAFVDAFVAGCP